MSCISFIKSIRIQGFITQSLIVLMVSLSFLPTMASAQAGPGGEAPKLSGPRKQVAIIVFSGLAGAVLGLSTLSFYSRPQEKLQNIGIGFAVGIIAGAAYTTYNAATKPHEFYGIPPGGTRLPTPELWKEEELKIALQESPPLSFNYRFSF